MPAPRFHSSALPTACQLQAPDCLSTVRAAENKRAPLDRSRLPVHLQDAVAVQLAGVLDDHCQGDLLIVNKLTVEALG